MSSDYRLAPALAARLSGGLLVLLALVVLAVAVATGLLRLPAAVVLGVAAGGLVVVAAASWWLLRRAYVVRVDHAGYRLRLVRGGGVRAARWVDVDDAVVTHVSGEACVVLRLRDGRMTTIPVAALAIDREEFVRQLQEHLQRGHGLRRL
ncbi:MAG: hypothetical protein R2731_00160 [Nocardioides sp.]